MFQKDPALEVIRRFQPEWGLVLGSGLGLLSKKIQLAGRLPFGEVQGLPVSQVPGHASDLVWGHLGRCKVLLASGRVHLYEGRSALEVTAAMRLLAGVGVRRVILTNAAGSLNAGQPPGSWMSICDHLNLTGTSPLLGGPNFLPMERIYTKTLRARFAAAAAAVKVPLYEGVYAGLVGPQYETPAEVRMLRAWGADAVGMSTVLEAIQAHALGLEVAGFSCLTNWAAGLSAEPLSHAGVLATGRAAAESFWRVLERALGEEG